MGLDHDITTLGPDWDDQDNPERAIETSARCLQAVETGARMPRLRELEQAAEPQFDGEGGEPVFVLRALRTAIPVLLREEAGVINTADRLGLRFRPQILLVRTHHVSRQPYEAVTLGYTLLHELLQIAGGQQELSAALRRAEANPLAEQTVGVLGIFMATIRRSSLPEKTRDLLTESCRQLVSAYVLDAEMEEPVLYPRTAALAAQGFYFFNELRLPGTEELIEALYALDCRSRPQNARGQATCALRELEWARYHYDADAMKRFRRQAIVDLGHYALRRHELAVMLNGYV
ncbi:hypothetical protein VSS74_25740 [Conexibacter stalactiti]|uniref:IrrE N-terminal-like domain-containing protein n=1 Tax=Conexibacter stalactiti TaxID=1940611 RepID=A0ABU4HWT1_9ACTN|nr:hypothetical protein [Conexibacter stalactiti]MDW5597781.1 hypothetical protein [Conexibacter stalactiti]MEC5038423.1 hypothetical protein [Conexibacter stalactiti]